jgi:hypothetical protein
MDDFLNDKYDFQLFDVVSALREAGGQFDDP